MSTSPPPLPPAAPPPAPPPLAYGRPARSGPAFSVTLFLASGFALVFMLATLVLVVPRFELIFKDFGATLPALTLVALALSRFCRRFFWACLAITVLLPTALGFIAGLFGQRTAPEATPLAKTARRLSIVTLVLVFLGLYVLFIALALFLPMISLIQTVSGQGGR